MGDRCTMDEKRGPGRDIFVAVAIAALTKAVDIGAEQLREYLKKREERRKQQQKGATP
jgi:hypothetical protein